MQRKRRTCIQKTIRVFTTVLTDFSFKHVSCSIYRSRFWCTPNRLKVSYSTCVKLVPSAHSEEKITLKEGTCHSHAQGSIVESVKLDGEHSILVRHRLTNNLTVDIYSDRLTLSAYEGNNRKTGEYENRATAALLNDQSVISPYHKCRYLWFGCLVFMLKQLCNF